MEIAPLGTPNSLRTFVLFKDIAAVLVNPSSTLT
jgi:hypothetical protein